MKTFLIILLIIAIVFVGLVVYCCCASNGNKPKWLQDLEDAEQREYLIKQSQKKLGNRYKRY